MLFYDGVIFDNIAGDVVVDEAKDIQVDALDWTFDFDDVLAAHFVGFCIHDHGNSTVVAELV